MRTLTVLTTKLFAEHNQMESTETYYSISNFVSFSSFSSSADGGNESEDDTDEESGYDSDVEREKNIDYTSKIYTSPLRSNNNSSQSNTKVVKPQDQAMVNSGDTK